MKTKAQLILAVFLLVFLTACATQSSGQQYRTANLGYSTTVNTVTALSRSNRVSVEQMRDFNELRVTANKYLDEWELSLLNKEEQFNHVDELLKILDEMILIELASKRTGDTSYDWDPGSNWYSERIDQIRQRYHEYSQVSIRGKPRIDAG